MWFYEHVVCALEAFLLVCGVIAHVVVAWFATATFIDWWRYERRQNYSN